MKQIWEAPNAVELMDAPRTERRAVPTMEEPAFGWTEFGTRLMEAMDSGSSISSTPCPEYALRPWVPQLSKS